MELKNNNSYSNSGTSIKSIENNTGQIVELENICELLEIPLSRYQKITISEKKVKGEMYIDFRVLILFEGKWNYTRRGLMFPSHILERSILPLLNNYYRSKPS